MKNLILGIIGLVFLISCNSHVDPTSGDQWLEDIANSQEYHNFRLAFDRDIAVTPRNPNFDFEGIFSFIDKYEVDDHRDIDTKLYENIKGAKEYFEIREGLHNAQENLRKKFGYSSLGPEKLKQLRDIYYGNQMSIQK